MDNAQSEPIDMKRWGALSDEQRQHLIWLFGESRKEAIEHITKEDGDALPLIKEAHALWQEIDELRESAAAFTSAFEQVRSKESYDHARVTLMVWYDYWKHPVRPLLGIRHESYNLPKRMVLFDVWQHPVLLPNVSHVDRIARELVAASVARGEERYTRKQQRRKHESRYTEALVQDLMEHFSATRGVIRNRLDNAVFSLEREFKDLAHPKR